MTPLSGLRLKKAQGLINNPHFWLLIILTVLFTTLYYFRVFFNFYPNWIRPLEMFEFLNQLHGSLFFIVIIYAAIAFRWSGILITTLLSVSLTVPVAIYYRPSIFPVLTNVFLLSLPLFIVSYITMEQNWRNKERKILQEREKERQAHLTQLFKAQEEERKRIAQELHDDSIQSLMAIANTLQNLLANEPHLPNNKLTQYVKFTIDELLHMSDDLRKLSIDLRPSILDNIGFLPALRWMIGRLNQEGSIDTRIVIKGEERKLPYDMDVIAFRILQEALNNIKRHAKATSVVVTLEFNESTVKMVVSDNGNGFSLPRKMDVFISEGKLGLMGIQERVRSLNGIFDIQSQPGLGTLVSVEFKC